jgi:hypothetical protein
MKDHTECDCPPGKHVKQNSIGVQILIDQFVLLPETWPVFERWVKENSGAPAGFVLLAGDHNVVDYIRRELAREALEMEIAHG